MTAHNPADNVTIQLNVQTLRGVNEIAMTYTIDGYLRVTWKDPRLAYDSAEVGSTMVFLTVADMWTPAIYFERVVEIKVGTKDGFGEAVHWSSDGSIFWSRQRNPPFA